MENKENLQQGAPYFMNTFSYAKYKDIKAEIRLHEAKLNYSSKVQKPEFEKFFRTTQLVTSQDMYIREILPEVALLTPQRRDFRKS